MRPNKNTDHKYTGAKYKDIPQINFKKAARKMGPKQYKNLVRCINITREIKEEYTWMKGTWFKSPGGSAGYRRYIEKQHTHDWKWIENGKLYEVHFSVTCSYNNYYTHKQVLVDGEEKDMRAVSASLARMEEEKEYQDRRRQEDTSND